MPDGYVCEKCGKFVENGVADSERKLSLSFNRLQHDIEGVGGFKGQFTLCHNCRARVYKFIKGDETD